MSKNIRQDTFHQYLDQTLVAAPLEKSARVRALAMGLPGPPSYRSLPEMGSVIVSLSTEPGDGGEQMTRIRLDECRESSTSCGEGYYEVVVDHEGTAVEGYTEYEVNGQLVRQCRVGPALGQKIADDVFRWILQGSTAND